MWLKAPVQVQVKRKGAPDTGYHLMGRAPKHCSELSLSPNTHTHQHTHTHTHTHTRTRTRTRTRTLESWWEHRGVSKATDYPHSNKHTRGWTHRRKRAMECFTQMENKRVRNWEKGHLHWSGLSVFTGQLFHPTQTSLIEITDAKYSVNIKIKNVTEAAPWLEE